MPQPTRSDVHLDAPLSNFAVAITQDPSIYVADKIFPIIPVAKASDKYFIWTQNDFFRDDAVTIRAPGTESSGSGLTLSDDSYSCDVWATHFDIYDQIRSNADAALNLEQTATRKVIQSMQISRERQFATSFFTTSVWGTDVTGNSNFTQWDDVTSNPLSDVETGKETIAQNTSKLPNTLLVGYQVHSKLIQHPLIKEQIKYTGRDNPSSDFLAQYFGVERYIVGRGTYASNNEGATAAQAFILGKNALLCYVDPAPSIMTATAGAVFSWSGFTDLNNFGIKIYSLREDMKKFDRIEGEFAYDLKVISSSLGYFFSSAVA